MKRGRRRKGLTINKTRNLLYLFSRILGDLAAISSGKVGKRVGRRVAGRMTGKFLGSLFRWKNF